MVRVLRDAVQAGLQLSARRRRWKIVRVEEVLACRQPREALLDLVEGLARDAFALDRADVRDGSGDLALAFVGSGQGALLRRI